ncbi:hypothetical protein TIFTF001_034336 [Ficus carica]|uniref:Uncharacterized protein n=1 Tax=Ficus carica TaxID=3494 RepID=A0AA88DZK9_FICCA|nr:hypothetical protein TIFTF001_034336 [Ficus carica]
MGIPVGCLLRAFRCLNVPRGHGCSGDPDGLNSECFQWVDMLLMYKHRTSNGQMPRVPTVWLVLVQVVSAMSVWPGGGSRRQDRHNSRAGSAGGLKSCSGSVARASTTGPDCGLLGLHSGERQHNGDGGRSIRFPGSIFIRSCSSRLYTAIGSFPPILKMCGSSRLVDRCYISRFWSDLIWSNVNRPVRRWPDLV